MPALWSQAGGGGDYDICKVPLERKEEVELGGARLQPQMLSKQGDCKVSVSNVGRSCLKRKRNAKKEVEILVQ